MFDLMRFGLPCVLDAHGKKWLCVYTVSSDDDNTYYLAVEAKDDTRSKDLPQPCSLIAAPHPPEVAKMRKEATARREAKEKGSDKP